MAGKYFLSQDDDSHWYLIPVELRAEFAAAREKGGDDDWEKFIDKFDQYRLSGGPGSYTFEKPEEIE